MEHKSWIWKKKSTEKTMIAADKINRGNEDEVANLADKVELHRNLKTLDEKLLAALAEINAKDEIAKKQTNVAREAIQEWEKAEAEIIALKEKLEKATQQRVADEERSHGADSALEECMLQLRFVREEQEKRVHDAVVRSSKEYEKRITDLEGKLAESNKKLSKLGSENSQLSNTLSVKEKIIDEQHLVRAQLDYDLRAVVSQLESTQRENASLSYEIQVLEKELEIRNEEREFNRRTSDMAHKQYLESVKKIAKLETEAQRLRLLVQKRLPGPADVARMKNVAEVTRRRSNPFPMESTDFNVDNTYSKKITFLTEQLSSFEEENKLLKEFLHQKTIELSKSQTSDMGSDEKVSMAGSWAPSYNTVGASDIGLMDDFVEMEKLALVSVDKPVADDIKVVLPEKDNCNFSVTNDKKEANGDKFDEGMNISIRKLIELIEGIRLSEKIDDSSPYKTSETPTGYTVHVFQWKTSELRTILDEFLQICNKLVNGKVGVEDFVKELTSSLAWIVNHCFSLQDVSSMKDEIKKQFEWDETRSESEVEGGTHLSEADKLTFPKDQLPGWPMASSWNVRNKIFQVEPNVREEIRKLKDEMAKLESENKDLEGKLESESAKCKSLATQLQEPKGVLKEQKDTLVDQTEVNVTVKDIERHPVETFDECNEAHQETISLKEQKSMTENDEKCCDLDHDETALSSEQELIAASDKLAECQETIVNLGKQLKAMASLPADISASGNSEITTSPLPDENNNQRVSLLDKMITEDPTGAPRSQKPKGISRTVTSPAILDGNTNPVVVMSPRMFVSVEGVKDEKDEEALVNFLSKKKNKSGGGILKRLFWRRKKGGKK
ncbi:filament-like plant protein 7 isoform X2 [Helianthus annuus]|uniref:filament-like plant protein 7 isoform X2 n=1 Tax=Helianthus annuus TaxID=4232 RepID=UPI001652B8A0|nr:filament-like plant protein 7 isoform X2 [Helianthus annuus]XP_035839191.1 filament-like plant protein 7 isoform X2 [Helianthus annuus]